jgi:cytochrome c6
MNKIFFILFFNFFVSLPIIADTTKFAKGKSIFLGKGMCAGCHILKDAKSQGNIGPNLNQLTLNFKIVASAVEGGIGLMPAFGSTGILTANEIELVTFYVVKSIEKN